MTFLAPLDIASIPTEPDPQNRSKNTVSSIRNKKYWNSSNLSPKDPVVFNFCTEVDLKKAIDYGVDGIIVVDLPPEEDDELYSYSEKKGLSFIRLITPTTTKDRLVKILKKATGLEFMTKNYLENLI